MEQGLQVTHRVKHRICGNNSLIDCTIDQLNDLMRELVKEYQKIKGMV
tara:strand:+ start:2866 stop:3009 length:144 start_codon:yes stop_codon:yes gene_type:complete